MRNRRFMMRAGIRKCFTESLLILLLCVCMFFGGAVSAGAATKTETPSGTQTAVKNTVKTGFVKKKGKTYYFRASGKKVTGLKKLIGTDGKEHTYLFDKNGVMQTGFRYFKKGNRVRYFDRKTGAMLTGKKKIKGYTYTFGKKDGVLKGVNKTVDQLANKKLNQLDRSLKKAYEWCRSFPYRAMMGEPSKGTALYASYGLRHGTGNCYVKAASFVAMARQLGYPARQLGGYCMTEHGKTPHSWAEVYYKGKWRVCDPSWGRRGSYMSGWMIYYGQKGTWVYQTYEKMKN